jgi:polar amino acid transport system substrate-binding protein
MVASGRLDLTLDSVHVLQYSINIQDPVLADQVDILDSVLKHQTIHMAVSKSRPDHAQIVADFNMTLSEMKQDGSLAILLAKHGTKPME